MEHAGIIVFSVCAVLLVVCWPVFSALNKKRTMQKLREGFGSVPDNDTDISSSARYWKELSLRMPLSGHVDELTWNDLNMDSVFERINCCQTSVGENYLYAMLHLPCSGEKYIFDREKLQDALRDEELRVDVQYILSRLGKCPHNVLPSLLLSPNSFAIEHNKRYIVQMILFFAAVLLCFFSPAAGGFAAVCIAALNSVTYFTLKHRIDAYFDTVHYLVSMAACAKSLSRRMADSCPRLTSLLNERLCICGDISSGMSAMIKSGSSEQSIIFEFIGMLTLLPIIEYSSLIQKVSWHREDAHTLYRLIGEIDAAICALSFERSMPKCCRPRFIDRLSVRGTEVYHPLLREQVPNDVNLERGILLTGTNASGKSTYVRSIGINIILAQTIYLCCARQFWLYPTVIASSMAVSDSVTEGDSYYVSEVRSMRRLVDMVQSGEPFYCIIDEILKGTNTVQRVSAAASVLEYLSRPSCLCIAATHDIELTYMLAEHYDNYHFCETITDSQISFDYTLKEGPCRVRNAILLLEHMGFPRQITDRAKEAEKQLEQ